VADVKRIRIPKARAGRFLGSKTWSGVIGNDAQAFIAGKDMKRLSEQEPDEL
jgi:hypothetical protein